MDNVVKALRNLRVGVIADEFILQQKIAEALSSSNIKFEKEYVLGPKNRVDFLTEKRIAIEVKKGKPNRTKLIEQINRYAEFEKVNSIIIVVETSIKNPISRTNNGKPCTIIGLRKLWGIAI